MGINVRNLVKEYGSQRAVDDISFEVRTGDILGFLGPNGAGKSTTMKIITCYLRPNSGSVDLDGYNIEDHANEVRRRIGYLPENNPLYLEMSIVDYLAYSAALNQVEKNRINSRVREMIEITGLTKERHKLIGELSKGYRQRVGLAQALIHDPDVLILDEPTTGLDPNQIVEIRSLIKEIGKEKTIMLSSHILQEVEATCDRIIIINQGKIAADATTADLKRRASGAERVRVQIAANGSAVGDALLALPGVSAIERDHDTKEDLWVIDSKPNQPVREQIFKLCVENNWILMQMTPVHTSLEDIFRQLTNKNLSSIVKEIQDKKIEKKTCQYYGVTLSKRNDKYRALLVHNKKQIHIGFFENELDAAKAYNKKASELNSTTNSKYKLNEI